MKIQFSPTERTSSLLPALTVSFGILIWLARRRFDTSVGELFDALSAHSSYATIAVFTLIFAGLLFLIAHALDLFSAFAFERLYVDKLHGFPHERIVPIDETTDRYKYFVKNKKVRGFTWLPHQPLKALIFSAYAIGIVLLVREYDRIDPWLNAYVAKVFQFVLWWFRASFVVSVAWIGLIAWRTRLPSVEISEEQAQKSQNEKRHFLLKTFVDLPYFLLVGIFTFAFDGLDHAVRKTFRLNKEIAPETFARMHAQLKERLKIDFKKLHNNDRFWISYLCLKQTSKTSVDEVDKALKQASFARNQSLALLICAVLLLASTSGSERMSLPSPCSTYASVLFTCDKPETTKETSTLLAKRINTELLTSRDLARMAAIFSIFHILFLLRYLVSYYFSTKTLFRALASLPIKRVKAASKAPSSESEAGL
jgi:hypothetical protein